MHALPIQFHFKRSFMSNLMVPSVYLALNIFVSLSLVNLVSYITDDSLLVSLADLLIPLAIITIGFYLLSAFTNPGHLIGNEQV